MMKRLSLILSCYLSALTLFAQENSNSHKTYIETGFSSGLYSSSFTGGLYGGVGFFFNSFNKKCALDFRAKEIYISSPEREAGAITVTYRIYFTERFYAGGGFAHNHEISFQDFLDETAGAILGNSKKIIHRTGAAIETGFDFKPWLEKNKFVLYPTSNLCMNYMVADDELNPLVTLNFGIRFGFKKQKTE